MKGYDIGTNAAVIKMAKWYDLTGKAKAKIRKQLADKHGWNCHYCGAMLTPDGKENDFSYCEANGYFYPQLDHKLPKTRGGDNSVDNLVLSCRICNREKSNMTAEEYIAWRSG